MDSQSASITVPDRVLFRDLDGEAVILHLDTGQYFGLNPMGTQMWFLLEKHGCVEKTFEALQESYQVSADLLRRDLLTFVDELVSRSLLETREAATGSD
jgi:hypothetical protein